MRLASWLSLRRPSTPRRVYRPRVEALEERCVPDASALQGNIFAIASQVLRDRATLNAIQPHLAAEAGNSSTGPGLVDQLAGIAARSQTEIAELQSDKGQVANAVKAQIAALEQLFAQETSQTLDHLNEQILALDSELAGLSGAQRQEVAKQVAEKKFRLKDGFEVALKHFRDTLRGKEHAVVDLFHRGIQINRLTLGRAEADEQLAEKLEGKAEALEGGSPSGPTPTGDPCQGQSPNKELQTNDPRFDGFISCAEYEALPSGQRPAVF
jgi:hypothetical protein